MYSKNVPNDYWGTAQLSSSFRETFMTEEREFIGRSRFHRLRMFEAKNKSTKKKEQRMSTESYQRTYPNLFVIKSGLNRIWMNEESATCN